ncbi:6817_t:CDS:2 [Funneliformis mosseae]|uniref:6817_t:CDS:1 n=1 Tax=Funneliformis mosseae TaxID=27381 RepID=A0A9N9HE25_FUNMO|nr:6817_t:CDS:2 [Funneliformis mosseae]
MVDLPTPRNPKEVRMALGLFSYYQHFIQDFAKITGLLYELTKKNEGLGVVLAQRDDQKLKHPIAYASRKLSDLELKYTTTEKE